MAAFIGIWTILVSIVGLNGFAAGMAAVLHVWRPQQRRRDRALKAAAITGFLPASLLAPAMIGGFSAGSEALTGLIIGFAAIYLISSVVSLPGATIVARSLERPGDAYRAFE